MADEKDTKAPAQPAAPKAPAAPKGARTFHNQRAGRLELDGVNFAARGTKGSTVTVTAEQLKADRLARKLEHAVNTGMLLEG